MARFTRSVHIAAAPEAVSAFVTNATQWHSWHPATDTPLGLSTVSYELQSEDGGTRFQRSREFASNGVWSLLDGNVAKWILKRQAAALENLRRRLEHVLSACTGEPM